MGRIKQMKSISLYVYLQTIQLGSNSLQDFKEIMKLRNIHSNFDVYLDLARMENKSRAPGRRRFN